MGNQSILPKNKYLDAVNVLGYFINSPIGEFTMNPVFVIKAARHFEQQMEEQQVQAVQD
jgi:hypothetical protein